MTLDPTLLQHLDGGEGEVLAEGGTWLLDLVAAVDYLHRGARPGITVWDAIGEAVRWSAAESLDAAADEADPSAVVVGLSLAGLTRGEAVVLQASIRRWVLVMADRYNEGCNWPHPATRRTFPPPRVDLAGA